MKILVLTLSWCLGVLLSGSFAADVKNPNVSGTFYPDNAVELAQTIDNFLTEADPEPQSGEIFGLIAPHAGYAYSGGVAAYGYKLIKDKPYTTVVVIGSSHHYPFRGISIYPEGIFRTPLGDLEIDKEFAQKLLYKDKEIIFAPQAFEKEHSLEVQLPFLQRVLSGFKIVPIVTGDSSWQTCQNLAALLAQAIGSRKDVLVVASTDMCHSYDYQATETMDNLTLSYLKNMDARGLYDGLGQGKLQLCGGFGVVSLFILSRSLGHNTLAVLKYTNSAEVTQRKIKGLWTVGYTSCVIDQEKGAGAMLTKEQRKKLLEIARKSIEYYLKTGKKLEVSETDSALSKNLGAFVTLHENGRLRGCIGNLVGDEPLYLTIRDMAVQAAVGDPRFAPVEPAGLKDIEIEISALSPLEKIDSAEKIEMGKHGVLIRKGFQSGVFLPQVATETGWSKEEFLSSLCAHKAGLAADAWKDKATEIYIFTAEVFSEENY
jgi:AmmeMemoRadiSam system protein B/AmmeMemoRadiSam system protein A